MSGEILAVSLKHTEWESVPGVAGVSYELTVTFDNGEILIVDPDDAVEERLAADCFRLDSENKRIDLIEFFLPFVR